MRACDRVRRVGRVVEHRRGRRTDERTRTRAKVVPVDPSSAVDSCDCTVSLSLGVPDSGRRQNGQREQERRDERKRDGQPTGERKRYGASAPKERAYRE